MRNQFLSLILILIGFILSGCDTGTGTTQFQDVGEVVWKADGSAIFGYIQNYTANSNFNPGQPGYSMARFNADGSLAQIFKTDPKSYFGITDFSYTQSIYLSQNGDTIVTQLDRDLYRFVVSSNALTKLDSQFHLVVVSPDLKYAVGTPSPDNTPIKTIQILDITVFPPRLVSSFELDSLAGAAPGIWFSTSGRFGLSVHDSLGFHISIFDTLGALKSTIGGAELTFHNVVFNRNTNDLFFRNRAAKKTDQFVDKINLSTMTRTTILPVSVSGFDITADENTIVYARDDSAQLLRSRNLSTLAEQELSSNFLRFAKLSPDDTKLAFVAGDQSFNSIHVINPFVKP